MLPTPASVSIVVPTKTSVLESQQQEVWLRVEVAEFVGPNFAWMGVYLAYAGDFFFLYY
jgi:hypothetical protein